MSIKIKIVSRQPDIQLPYWRNEITGNLGKAVERYFAFSVGDDLTPLTETELNLMKYYIFLWLEYPWLNLEPQLEVLRQDLLAVKTTGEITHLITKAQIIGIDPFSTTSENKPNWKF